MTTSNLSTQRKHGVYYTNGNPFASTPFRRWAGQIDFKKHVVVEPFAGNNDIIKKLKSVNLCNQHQSYDLNPVLQGIEARDSINNFPKNFKVCITNPPWLAKNYSTKTKISDYNFKYDNIYKDCLELMLSNCQYVAALIPASYSRTGLFFDRLHYYVLLHDSEMFLDTTHPVCLALFSPQSSNDFYVYYDNKKIGNYRTLKKHLPGNAKTYDIKFNAVDGNLGFIAFDNTKERTIKFCDVNSIENYSIKHSSRFITKIKVDYKINAKVIGKLNENIERFRDNSKDFFLTPFKGIRQDGMYRRRIDFSMTKKILIASLYQ